MTLDLYHNLVKLTIYTTYDLQDKNLDFTVYRRIVNDLIISHIQANQQIWPNKT